MNSAHLNSNGFSWVRVGTRNDFKILLFLLYRTFKAIRSLYDLEIYWYGFTYIFIYWSSWASFCVIQSGKNPGYYTWPIIETACKFCTWFHFNGRKNYMRKRALLKTNPSIQYSNACKSEKILLTQIAWIFQCWLWIDLSPALRPKTLPEYKYMYGTTEPCTSFFVAACESRLQIKTHVVEHPLTELKKVIIYCFGIELDIIILF